MVSMADPQIIQCASDCTVTVVHQFALPVLDLSMSDAAQISSAVLLVWAVGFGFRCLIRALNSSDGNQPFEEKP